MKLYKKVVITGCESDGLRGVPYLTRWRLIESRFGAVYLHKFHRSDGKDLHDHPWAFASLILWRGYIEETVCLECQGDGWFVHWAYGQATCERCGGNGRVRSKAWPATILFRRPAHTHRVELIDEKPAWTLIVRGPYVRTWGFWVDGAWESFKDYFARRGC